MERSAVMKAFFKSTAKRAMLGVACASLSSGFASAELAEAPESEAEPHYDNELILVVGAAGEPEYGEIFDENQLAWERAAALGNTDVTVVDSYDEEPLTAVQEALESAAKESPVPLWIVLIGHGTSNRQGASFNLKGPDLKLHEFEEWLNPFQRPLIVINTSSSSGAFLPVLSRPDRIVVTATKSGNELNFASFGSYLAGSLLRPEADLNNDGQNSVYECFYHAARETATFYEQEGRIATEHPLLDDNGDGKGTSFEALEAFLMGGESQYEIDGDYAKRWSLILSPEERALPPEMRQTRNQLEAKVDTLRREKSEMPEETYYERLEDLVTQIAKLYESVGAFETEDGKTEKAVEREDAAVEEGKVVEPESAPEPEADTPEVEPVPVPEFEEDGESREVEIEVDPSPSK